MAESLVKLLHWTLHSYEQLVNQIDELVDPFDPAPTPASVPPEEFEYRPDTLWARPVMWWEMALGAAGVGTYLASAANGSRPGRLLGAGLVLGGKGSLLMADLGRPERALRVFRMPHTSWISRGAWSLGIFSAGVVGQLIADERRVRPSSKIAAEAVTALAALLLISYDGLFLNASKGVGSWTRSALPVLLTANGVLTGATISRLVAPAEQPAGRVLTIAAGATQVGAAACYLHQLAAGDASCQASAAVLRAGHERRRARIGAGLIGTGVPLAAALLGPRRRAPQLLAASAALLGATWLRKSVLRAGRHAPIIAPIDEAGWPW